MTRIALLRVDELTPAQRQQYNRFPTNLALAMLRTTDSTEAYLSLGGSLTRSTIVDRDRELVILRVGALSGSAYERMQHLPLARAAGWSDEAIAAIEAGDQTLLGTRDGVLLRFVDDCVHHARVADANFAAVSGFLTETAVTELVLLIGHYMMTARLLETLEVALDDAPADWSHIKTG